MKVLNDPWSDEGSLSLQPSLGGPFAAIFGAVIGACLAGFAFGIVVLIHAPNDSVIFLAAGGLVLRVAVIGAIAGSGLAVTRPITRWWLLAGLVLLAASLGYWLYANTYWELLQEGCLQGTGPQESLCARQGVPTDLRIAAAIASALVAFALGTFGVRQRRLLGSRTPQANSGARHL